MDRGDAHVVGDLTWDEVERRLDAGAFAILPIGSGAKEHGWHLPMRTDAILAEWLSAQFAERVPALIWPPVTYGHYPAFASYAGSCTLSAQVFEAMARELVDALLSYGPRAVLVLDTGISTNAPIARAIADVESSGRALHLKIYEGAHYRAAAARLETQRHGCHADELETSQMLALAEELVRMDRAAPGPAEPPAPGPMQHCDPSAANFSESGCIGDPTLATAEKGRILLQAIVEDMIDSVRGYFPFGRKASITVGSVSSRAAPIRSRQ